MIHLNWHKINRWLPVIVAALIIAGGIAGFTAAIEHNQSVLLRRVSELQTYHGLCIRNPAVSHTVSAIDACVARYVEVFGLD